jgi:cyclase
MIKPRGLLYPAAALVIVVLGLATRAPAQQDMSDIHIQAQKVADGIYMLTGRGGNMGLSAGPDGGLLIDDEFAPLTEKIRAVVDSLGGTPLRTVFNTHWHGDHVGGNENLGTAGITIVAQENVRRRMSTMQFRGTKPDTVPASPAKALPIVTFQDSLMFHLNGQDIAVFHVAPAHTDGDAVVWFRNANVVHCGDTFFNGLYPVIDVSSGGSIDGMIAADDRILKLVNDETKIIPGHGPLGDKAKLKEFRDMLAGVSANVKKLVAKKMTKDQVIAAKPTAAWDEAFAKGGRKPDGFVGVVYDDLSRLRRKSGR